MTKEAALQGARQVARANRVNVAVVNDAVANAEDESGPYGFAPLSAWRTLFSNGKVEVVVRHDGKEGTI